MLNISKNQRLRRQIILTLAIMLILMWSTPRSTNALSITGHVFTTRINITPTDPDWWLKFVIKPAVRVFVRELLNQTTQDIVRWIQGDNGKNVGFVSNPQRFFRNVADRAGGEFLNKLSSINLCGNIGPFLQISLRTPPGLEQKLACSLTDIVQNVNSFYRNFNNGGWKAFISASVEPQNNPYGAYLIALQAKVDAESSALNNNLLKLNVSHPFLGFEVTKPKNCRLRVKGSGTASPSSFVSPDEVELRPDIAPTEEQTTLAPDTVEEVCDTETETLTPGQLVHAQLAKAAGSGIDYLVNSDDIDRAFSAIAQALINRIINSPTGLFAGSNPDQDPGQISLPGAENAGWFISRTQSNILYADALITAINNQLKNSYQELFVLRRNPPPQQTEESIPDPIRTLENKIFNLHRSKTDIIATKNELLTLKRTISFTTDARQLIEASSQMQLLANRLNTSAFAVQVTAVAAASVGSQKWDTVQEIQGSIDSISSTLTLVNTMADEAGRIASTTTVTGRRSELERLNADLLNRTSRPLEILRNNLTLIKDRLTRALGNEEIQVVSAEAMAALEQVNTPLKNADDAVQRADAALKQP